MTIVIIIHGDLIPTWWEFIRILEIITRIETKLPDYRLTDREASNIFEHTIEFLTDSDMFSWSTAKCFVDILRCILMNNFEISLGNNNLNIISRFIIRNLTTDIFDNTLNGARQLLLSAMTELVFSQYLKIGRTEDIIDLIRLCFL